LKEHTAFKTYGTNHTVAPSHFPEHPNPLQ